MEMGQRRDTMRMLECVVYAVFEMAVENISGDVS